jgi:cell division septation protein DedD
MSDEGFREIQLSGKQLIALFMTAAVVLIATFLSGVLVGRGVRAQLEPATSTEAVQATTAAIDPTAPPAASKPVPPAEQPAPPVTPPPQADDGPAVDARGQAAPGAATPGQAGAAATTDARTKGAAPAAAPTSGAVPEGTAFYVKVVAYRGKAQADKVAARLSAKGYSAYVVPVTTKGTALYSVRVGTFQTRGEADAARRRLEQEEQFKPSIAR